MKPCVLRPNAAPIYHFLSFIMHNNQAQLTNKHLKILDCGAGGVLPPLALFYEQDFICCGIDLSQQALQSAQNFCSAHQIEIDFKQADMKSIPYENESFDYVYEHYSMCHLTKAETVTAAAEMKRVLKTNGYAYLGVISRDTWPLTGKESSPGEFLEEEGGTFINHTYFTDQEADSLVADWQIIQKEKRIIYRTKQVEALSEPEWAALFDEINDGTTKEQWQSFYHRRQKLMQYTHIYYILKKI